MPTNITQTEAALETFAEISDPNSIAPKTVADLLTFLLDRVEQAIQDIYEDGSQIQVYAYNGGPIWQILNDLNSRIVSIVQQLAEAYKLPHIRVASREDELLKTLEGGTYSVVINSIPHILVVRNTANAKYQYLFNPNKTNFIVYYRRCNADIWSDWTSNRFSGQEYVYSVDFEHNQSGIYADLSDLPETTEGVYHIKAYQDGSDLTQFTGLCCIHFRADENAYYYKIIAPHGIYTRKVVNGTPETDWTYKAFTYNTDLTAIENNITDIQTLLATPYTLPHIVVSSETAPILETLESGMYSVIIGGIPKLFVSRKTDRYCFQYIIDFNTSNLHIKSRRMANSVFTQWQTWLLSGQESSYDVGFDDTDGISFDLSELPFDMLPAVLHIRIYPDGYNSQTLCMGLCHISYDEDTAIYNLKIVTSEKVYEATGTDAENMSAWTEKQIAFQSDIEAVLGYTLSQLQAL